MSRRALQESLERFLIEDARVDRLVVQLAECDERCERDAAVAAAERAVHQQRKQKRRDLVGKRRVRLAAEGCDLRTLNGVDETELRLDDAGMCGRSTEFRADRAVNLDQILDGEVARSSAVSR